MVYSDISVHLRYQLVANRLMQIVIVRSRNYIRTNTLSTHYYWTVHWNKWRFVRSCFLYTRIAAEIPWTV